MKRNHFRTIQLCLVGLFIFFGVVDRTSASPLFTAYFTFSTDDVFSAVPTVSPPIGGGLAPGAPNQINIFMSVAFESGPAFIPDNPGSGWAFVAGGTVIDNLGDEGGGNLFLRGGDCLCASSFGFSSDVLAFSSVPDILLLAANADLVTDGDGPATVEFSMTVGLPNGLSFTPLPATLPLFAAGLAALGLLRWRRRQ